MIKCNAKKCIHNKDGSCKFADVELEPVSLLDDEAPDDYRCMPLLVCTSGRVDL